MMLECETDLIIIVADLITSFLVMIIIISNLQPNSSYSRAPCDSILGKSQFSESNLPSSRIIRGFVDRVRRHFITNGVNEMHPFVFDVHS